MNFLHPHLALIPRGFSVVWERGIIAVHPTGFDDSYGHGTCCAALIHWLAPDARILAVRVTADRASTDTDRLAAGITAAVDGGAQIVSVSMGTKNLDRRGLLDRAVEGASAGAVVVAADPGGEVLPACCAGVLAVGHLEGVDVIRRKDGTVVAEGIARELQHPASRGAPGASNFLGPSLATARAAAALARFAEQSSGTGEALLKGFFKSLDVR